MLHAGVLRLGRRSLFSSLPQAAGLEFARTAALLLLPVRWPLRLLLLQPARRKGGFAVHLKFPGHAAGVPVGTATAEIQHRKAAMDSLSSSPFAGCGTGPTRLKGEAPCAGATRRNQQYGAGPWGCAAPGDHFSVHANRACAGASGFCSCGPATTPAHRQCVAD